MKRKQTDPVSLFYRATGEGEAIIMLHGNGEDGSIFLPSSSILSETSKVYLPDSRSHGESPDAPVSYSLMAEDVRKFIIDHKIEKPILYGFSDGGIIALILASKYPGMVSKIIVSGANTKPSALKRKVRTQIRKEYEKTHSPLFSMMLEEPHLTQSFLSRIEVPTYIIQGEYDMIEKRNARRIRNAITGSHLITLKGEDHGSYIAGSEKIGYIIRDILEGKITKRNAVI